MKNANLISLKSALLLLGSFIFAYTASEILYHLGLAISIWSRGEAVSGILIHPFSWSYMCYSEKMANSILTAWAGTIFCVVVACLLLSILWQWRGPYTAIGLIISSVLFIYNGMYIIVDCLSVKGPGSISFGNSGLPEIVTVSIGVFLLLTGIGTAILIMPFLGIDSTDKIKRRILVLGTGIFPYLGAMFIYNWKYDPGEFMLWGSYVFGGVFIVIILSVISKLIHSRINVLYATEVKVIKWPAVILANFLAISILSILFVGVARSNSNEFLFHDVRPDDFPDILRVPDDAENVHYFTPSDSSVGIKLYSVGFILPTKQNKLSGVLKEFEEYFVSKKWTKLGYLLAQPEKPADQNWEQLEDGESLSVKNYRLLQEYINPHNQYLRVPYSYQYNPDSNKSQDVELLVIQTLFKECDSNSFNARFLRYRELHPEEFGKQTYFNGITDKDMPVK